MMYAVMYAVSLQSNNAWEYNYDNTHHCLRNSTVRSVTRICHPSELLSAIQNVEKQKAEECVQNSNNLMCSKFE